MGFFFIWTNFCLAGQLSCTRVTGFSWAGSGGLSIHELRWPLFQLRLILNQILGFKTCRSGSGCCMAYTLRHGSCLLLCRGGLDAGLSGLFSVPVESLGYDRIFKTLAWSVGCVQHSVLSTATFIRKAPFFPAAREVRTCWQQYAHKVPDPRTSLCYQPFLGLLHSSHNCSLCLILPHPGLHGSEPLSWNNKL